MNIPLPNSPLTAADFIIWDATQTIRYEFVDGRTLEIPDADDQHNLVRGNIALAMKHHLTGTACRVYMSDMKLQVAARQNYFYPDVFVTCSDADRDSKLVKSEPKLIIEVLSASTAAYDRGEKIANYRAIPTLREYALIDIDKRSADVYRLGDQGLWVLHPMELAAAGSSLSFASVELTMSAEQLFADI